MNFNILREFRQALYGCFEQGRDALFNLADALLSETTAHSVIELSLSPFFSKPPVNTRTGGFYLYRINFPIKSLTIL